MYKQTDRSAPPCSVSTTCWEKILSEKCHQIIRTVKLAIFIYKADYTYSTVTGCSGKSKPHSSSTHTITSKAPEIKGKLMTLVKRTHSKSTPTFTKKRKDLHGLNTTGRDDNISPWIINCSYILFLGLVLQNQVLQTKEHNLVLQLTSEQILPSNIII